MKVTIEKVENGFVISYIDTDNVVTPDVEKKLAFGGLGEEEDNFVEAGMNALWELIELFSLRGDRHDRERLRVLIEVGDKYVPRDDEELVSEVIEHIRMKR